jgi:hypothetical protein
MRVGRARSVRDRDPVTDGDECASTGAIDASEPVLPGGDVTVDEMSDASFPASDSPSRWTWEIKASAGAADDAEDPTRPSR